MAECIFEPRGLPSIIEDAILSYANLSKANLRISHFAPVQDGLEFEATQLDHADLTDADLSDADLQGVNLQVIEWTMRTSKART
jgi:uncharacterized protein YjbI with pentapeptide repeats